MKKSSTKIRLVLADDEPLARAGIRAILSRAEDIEVVGEAQDGFETQRLVAELHPNILLLDYQMPGPRPADLERWVRENYSETATLVLTAHDHQSHLAVMLEAGAAGYLTKGVSENRLIDSIRLAARGVVHFNKEQLSIVQHWNKETGQKWKSLSKRERQILKLLALGAGNRFIADELSISLRTAEDHVLNILSKLEVDTRQEAATWMLKNLPDEML